MNDQNQAGWEWLQMLEEREHSETDIRELEVEAYLITAESKPARKLPTRNKAHLVQRATNPSKPVNQGAI